MAAAADLVGTAHSGIAAVATALAETTIPAELTAITSGKASIPSRTVHLDAIPAAQPTGIAPLHLSPSSTRTARWSDPPSQGRTSAAAASHCGVSQT